MSTLSVSGLALPGSIRGKILIESAKESYLSQLSPKQPVDLVNTSILSLLNYSGSQTATEGEAKNVSTISSKVVQVQTGVLVSQIRVSKQAQWYDEQARIGLVEEASKMISQSVGADVDIIATNATSPASGANSIDFTKGLAVGSDTVVQNIASTDKPSVVLAQALQKLRVAGTEVTGIVCSPEFYWNLAYEQNAAGVYVSPQLTLIKKNDPNATFQSATIKTYPHVAFKNFAGTQSNNVAFIAGDFSQLVWGLDPKGFSWFDQGDPDNTGRDLAGHNEVMIRVESVLQYAILDKSKFVVGKNAA